MKKTKVRPRRMLLDRMVEIDAHCTALQNLCKNQSEVGTERNGNNGPPNQFQDREPDDDDDRLHHNS